MVKWRGAKNSRAVFNSWTGTLLRVNVFNNAAGLDTQTDTYTGLLGFARKKCGLDMMLAFEDGRITWSLFDYEKQYEPMSQYYRLDGQQSSTMLQFNRRSIGEKDLGNTKKDQFYLVLEGLDQVDFGAKDKVTCLESVQVGTYEDTEEDISPCAAWDKDLGW